MQRKIKTEERDRCREKGKDRSSSRGTEDTGELVE